MNYMNLEKNMIIENIQLFLRHSFPSITPLSIVNYVALKIMYIAPNV